MPPTLVTQYLGFCVKGIDKDLHSRDAIAPMHQQEMQVRWMTKCYEKAAKIKDQEALKYRTSTFQLMLID